MTTLTEVTDWADRADELVDELVDADTLCTGDQFPPYGGYCDL